MFTSYKPFISVEWKNKLRYNPVLCALILRSLRKFLLHQYFVDAHLFSSGVKVLMLQIINVYRELFMGLRLTAEL